ncbi:MAG: hypothetical protein SNH88_07640 [Rikenellaceae bacterium]
MKRQIYSISKLFCTMLLVSILAVGCGELDLSELGLPTTDGTTQDDSTGDSSTGDSSTGDDSTGDSSTGDSSTGDETGGGETNSITISSSQIIGTSGAVRGTIKFTATEAWTIDAAVIGGDDWFALDAMSGVAGAQEIEYRLEVNVSEKVRTATLSIITASETIDNAFFFSQNSLDIMNTSSINFVGVPDKTVSNAKQTVTISRVK